MLSSAASAGGNPSRLERLKRWYRSETIDPVKRSCNLVRRERERERKREKSKERSHQEESIAHLLSFLLLNSNIINNRASSAPWRCLPAG